MGRHFPPVSCETTRTIFHNARAIARRLTITNVCYCALGTFAFTAALAFRVARAPAATSAAQGAITDAIIFGNARSEQAHHFLAKHARVIIGGCGQSAIRLLPYKPARRAGGTVAFTLRCSPRGQNYVTLKLWGSDYGTQRGRLVLFCDGKQLGYLLQGDYDVMNGAENAPRSAPFRNRFYYVTTPLPLRMTGGHHHVKLKVHSWGRQWAYGGTWRSFQHRLTRPSLAMYRMAIGTNCYYVPPAGDRQGRPQAPPPTRPAPGPKELARLEKHVADFFHGLMRGRGNVDVQHLDALAKAYNTRWCFTWRNAAVRRRVISDMDQITQRYFASQRKEKFWTGPGFSGWTAMGPAADGLRRIMPELAGKLRAQMVVNGDRMTRRAAWGRAIAAARGYLERHRRLCSNQCMIVDLNLYYCNKALELMHSPQAWPEKKARGFLYQALGMQPFSGRLTKHG